jgi:rhodanese-related sulfurtransferase
MGVLSRFVATGLFLMLFSGGHVMCLHAQEKAARISVEELKAMLDKPSVTVIDVRQPHQYKESPRKIKGAVRQLPNKVEAWADNYPKDQTLVIYCQ